MRLHAGFIKDPTAAARVRKAHFPFSRMQKTQSFAGRRSPGREIPHAPQTRPPRPPKRRGRSWRTGDRRSDGRQEGDRLRRMRMRRTRWAGASGCACAHAGHASRTLFANATADIFLRSISNAAIFLRRICYCRICLCRYYVGHNAIAAILRRYSLLHIMTTADITTVDITTVDITIVDILYCSYTHITYSQHPPHSPHSLLTQS